jgi:formylmethanofuran dehydrogenase subunit E
MGNDLQRITENLFEKQIVFVEAKTGPKKFTRIRCCVCGAPTIRSLKSYNSCTYCFDAWAEGLSTVLDKAKKD